MSERDALRAALDKFANGWPGGDIEPATHYNRCGDWECNYCQVTHDNIAMLKHTPGCPVTIARNLLDTPPTPRQQWERDVVAAADAMVDAWRIVDSKEIAATQLQYWAWNEAECALVRVAYERPANEGGA